MGDEKTQNFVDRKAGKGRVGKGAIGHLTVVGILGFSPLTRNASALSSVPFNIGVETFRHPTCDCLFDVEFRY